MQTHVKKYLLKYFSLVVSGFYDLRGYVRKNQTKMENSRKNVKTQNRSNSGY